MQIYSQSRRERYTTSLNISTAKIASRIGKVVWFLGVDHHSRTTACVYQPAFEADTSSCIGLGMTAFDA